MQAKSIALMCSLDCLLLFYSRFLFNEFYLDGLLIFAIIKGACIFVTVDNFIGLFVQQILKKR